MCENMTNTPTGSRIPSKKYAGQVLISLVFESRRTNLCGLVKDFEKAWRLPWYHDELPIAPPRSAAESLTLPGELRRIWCDLTILYFFEVQLVFFFDFGLARCDKDFLVAGTL
jgi:hypothetical protein